MRLLLSALLSIVLFQLPVLAQSGRVKKKAEEEKKPQGVYVPTQEAQPSASPVPSPIATPPPLPDEGVINVESNLVPVPVSVVSRDTGAAVTDLSIADFNLFVDGSQVAIDELLRSESPVRLALLFDNSSSVTVAREFEQKAAIRFFRQVIRPKTDLAALYSVSGVIRLEQPLTRDVGSLVDAIRALPPPQGATSLHDAIISASEYLREQTGRRVIVVVSDGQDTLSDSTFDEMVEAVQRNNCQVYIVHTNEFENFKRTGSRSGSANLRALAAERRMQTLALQTGGAVYSPIDEDELTSAFARISAELSNQYLLVYYPEDEAKDGRFREVEVRIRSATPIIIRARKGYYVGRKRGF